MLPTHSSELLDSIWKCQPSMIDAWAMKTTGKILAEEGQQLVELLQPPQGQSILHTLKNFSLDHIVAMATEIAPTLCNALHCVSSTETQHEKERTKNKDLVYLSSIPILILYSHVYRSWALLSVCSHKPEMSMLVNCKLPCAFIYTVNPAGPVFHLFSSGNPYFVI